MKTKYILHGGYAEVKNDKNNKFFKEILDTDKKELSILLVLFAREDSKYAKISKPIIDQFNTNNVDKVLNFEIADKRIFVEQIKRADVVYLRGGETLKLLHALKACENFAELIKGKTVAGESAGAYVLSTFFYSKSLEKFLAGLRLVPVKTICHYIGKNRDKLSDCPTDVDELLLKDYEYKCFN